MSNLQKRVQQSLHDLDISLSEKAQHFYCSKPSFSSALRVAGSYKGHEPDWCKSMILGQMHYIGQSSSFWRDKITLERAMLVLDHIFTPFGVSTPARVRGNRSRTFNLPQNSRKPCWQATSLEHAGVGSNLYHSPPGKNRTSARRVHYLKNFRTALLYGVMVRGLSPD